MKIVLKDRDGNPVTYDATADAMRVILDDGTEQMMLPGEAQEKSVELDFSRGDMQIVPDDGKLLTGVTIPAPTNLIPGNIAEGVDIAGIVGTLVVGGGGGGVIAFGEYTPTTTGAITIEHGLGVVPDFVLVVCEAPAEGSFVAMYNMSAELHAKLGLTYPSWYSNLTSDGITASQTTSNLDKSSFVMSGIPNTATDTTFKLGGGFSNNNHLTTCTYRWFAIGGLT